MTNQTTTSVENNFTRGLITDSTGLNFPENAATDTDNCEYTVVGDVLRRQGIDYEVNSVLGFADRTNAAVSSYKWNNAGGDGETQIVVVQVGSTLDFYLSSSATTSSPISAHQLATSVDLNAYAVGNSVDDVRSQECQYADGNGFLFIFHPSCNPVYITYTGGSITASSITVKIRDFVGVKEDPALAVDNRPATLSATHSYNLFNQGWTKGSGFHVGTTAGSGSPIVQLGPLVVNLTASGLGFVAGDIVNFTTLTNTFPGGVYIPAGTTVMSGTVTGYAGVVLSVNITDIYSAVSGSGLGPYSVGSTGKGYIETWNSAAGNYPSNADVWWYFKNASDAFDPATTIPNVTLASGRAPQGHYIYDAFNQTKSLTSAVAGLTDVTTTKRPRTGCWFQGRVWYAGADDSQAASGTADFYSWTENIYFSQVVETLEDVGNCYQVNDPTSDRLSDILQTDGGVLTIPGCGPVYKLFPIQNGLLIFAGNGVWFVTGSQGIGFTANDYTVTKLSAIQSVSSSSFVDVFGLPYFWNDEGIYQVTPQQNGSLSVVSLTVNILESFYSAIPISSKRKARGAFDPINYTIQWLYKDTESTGIQDSYTYNRILNFNTYNKAFFPYSISTTPAAICSILYVNSPGGLNTPDPMFKYVVSSGTVLTFADEHDTDYVDWATVSSTDYISYFVTGYKLRGNAIMKFQPVYVQMWYRTNDTANAYTIQGIWDYANDPDSGRYSAVQKITTGLSRYKTLYKRHKIRGHGYSLQIKISSVTGMAFDIQGWAIMDSVNTGT